MVLVVVKALDILELVAREPERAHSLTEIAERLQMNQATCVNILKTLVDKNYLEHLGRKRGYRLGPMAYSLTGSVAYGQQLITAAKDVMNELTGKLNETSILGILRNHKRFILHIVNSDQDLQVRSRTERDAYETATGRLLMAYLPTKAQESFVQAVGLPANDVWPEAATPETLQDALTKIRQEALAVTYSRTHIVGLAVPIYQQEQVVAALSVFLPEVRYSAERQTTIIQALNEAAQRISRQINP